PGETVKHSVLEDWRSGCRLIIERHRWYFSQLPLLDPHRDRLLTLNRHPIVWPHAVLMTSLLLLLDWDKPPWGNFRPVRLVLLPLELVQSPRFLRQPVPM